MKSKRNPKNKAAMSLNKTKTRKLLRTLKSQHGSEAKKFLTLLVLAGVKFADVPELHVMNKSGLKNKKQVSSREYWLRVPKAR